MEEKELIRIIDDDEPELGDQSGLMSPGQAEARERLFPPKAAEFATLAKKASEIHCAKWGAFIDAPGLDPLQKWLCTQCHDYRMKRAALRPRTVFPDRDQWGRPQTYVNPKRQAKKAAKREAVNGR
jgi:hypothetical protein